MVESSGQQPGENGDHDPTRHDGGRVDAGPTRNDGGGPRHDGAPFATRFDGGRAPQDDAPVATRHDGGRTGPSGGRSGSDSWRGDTSAPLPPPLKERFRVVEELGTPGAEGRVLLVDDREAGERRILKLYWRHIELDPDAVRSLRQISDDPEGQQYLVNLYDADRVQGQGWYELQEYCAGGSLRHPIGELRTIGAYDVAQQVGQALVYLQGRIIFRDIKPANLMVRSVDELEIVPGDFGLVRTMGAYSERFMARAGTIEYLPPEANDNRVTPAWDWWSFGMVVAELALGRHPLAYADRSMPHVDQIPALIRDHSLDLSEIGDERLRALCQGLLLRDYRRRWRAEQVEQWLAGLDPHVPADVFGADVGDEAAARPADARPRTRVQFAGRLYGDPDGLAAAFQEQWAYAIDRLFDDRGDQWIADVEALLREHELLGAAQAVAHGAGDATNRSKALAALLLDMSLQIEPVFDGLWLTPAGLRDAAEDVLAGRRSSAQLDAVRRAKVLQLWRPLQGIADTRLISDGWDDGAHEVDRLIDEVAAGGAQLRRAAGDRAKAWILLCRLGANYAAQLRDELAQAREGSAIDVAWWQMLAAEGAESDAAAALAVVTANQAALLATEQEARDELSDKEERDRLNDELDLERLRRRDNEATAALGRARGQGWWWPGYRAPPAVGWLPVLLGGGLVAGNLSLHGTYEPQLREYFTTPGTPAPTLDDSLGVLDALSRNTGAIVWIVLACALLHAAERRMIPRFRTVRWTAVKVASLLAHAVLVGAVVYTGLVLVLLGDAASHYEQAGLPAGFLPEWAKFALFGFGALVCGGLGALAHIVRKLVKVLVGTYPY